MAQFKWIGIDLEGKICKGKTSARSNIELDRFLLSQEIGLIKYREIKPYFIKTRIKKTDKIKFIQHLSILLQSEIRLSQALQIVSNTTTNLYLKNILKEINLCILEGQSFSNALACYPQVFDSVLITLVSVGEETGKLSYILSLLSNHMETIEQYQKKLKSSLLMPLFIFIAFIFLMLAIFIFVIPRFQNFFVSFKGPLPKSTKMVFVFSDWINSIYSLYFLSVIFIFISCLYFYIKKSKNSLFFQKIVFKLPFLSTVLKLLYKTRFLQNLSLLLKGGVHLPYALEVIASKTNNSFIQKELDTIKNKILSGNNLSLALNESYIFSSEELVTLIEVGESSAEVSKMVDQASLIYKTHVYKTLERTITFMQPLILIVLGLLIAGLIFSLYLPLFSLSYMTC